MEDLEIVVNVDSWINLHHEALDPEAQALADKGERPYMDVNTKAMSGLIELGNTLLGRRITDYYKLRSAFVLWLNRSALNCNKRCVAGGILHGYCASVEGQIRRETALSNLKCIRQKRRL